MKCKKCGNTKDFVLVGILARFDNEKNVWIEDREDDIIMCNECNSSDIQDEEWDFE